MKAFLAAGLVVMSAGYFQSNVSSPAPTIENRPSTATITSVSQNNLGILLLSPNASRRMALIYNDASSDMLLKYGAGATSTSFTVRLAANANYELPFPAYTGEIDGIWLSTGTGSARITEVQ